VKIQFGPGETGGDWNVTVTSTRRATEARKPEIHNLYHKSSVAPLRSMDFQKKIILGAVHAVWKNAPLFFKNVYKNVNFPQFLAWLAAFPHFPFSKVFQQVWNVKRIKKFNQMERGGRGYSS